MEEQQALGLAAQQRSLEERDAETERICNEIKKRDTSRMDALAIALTKLSHN